MNTLRHKTVACIVSALVANAVFGASSIEPPKISVVDRRQVNMVNGQVVHTLPTVAIGGAMGLLHSVSIDANEFKYQGYQGFRDKFYGQARNAELSTDPYFSPRNVLRVYDFAETVDFLYCAGAGACVYGQALQQYGAALATGYWYQSMGDERHTLVVDPGNSSILIWTKPDGTQVRFWRGGQNAATEGLLTDITYPNGFRIDVVYGGMSVNTNTGFQLKALYPADNRPLDKADNPNLVNAPPANSASWALQNPKYIKAINNAYEYCAPTATDCTLTNTWPTATFNWPAGMPRTMFIGTSDVTVTDSAGRTTTYRYQAYDLAYASEQGGPIVQGQTLGHEMSPRLILASTASSPARYAYDYKNIWATLGGDGAFGTWDVRLQSAGVVISATRGAHPASGYNMLGRYYDDLYNTNGDGVWAVQVHAHTPDAAGAIYYVDGEEGRMWYENSARNFPTQLDPSVTSAPRQNFTYERGNLKRITYQQQVPSETTYIEAGYPADCVSTPRKTCNKPLWIRDARGNYTYLTYHTASGQLESVRSPADNDGVYPETHYEYQAKQAYYYAGGGSKIYGSPIWMKTAERSCINSNYTGRTPAATCIGGDEVVTRFEYNDNLLVKGVTVTADGATHRTCYQYDRYGNQIGKVEPNANLSSCN
jgi:hypothetical protein